MVGERPDGRIPLGIRPAISPYLSGKGWGLHHQDEAAGHCCNQL